MEWSNRKFGKSEKISTIIHFAQGARCSRRSSHYENWSALANGVLNSLDFSNDVTANGRTYILTALSVLKTLDTSG